MVVWEPSYNDEAGPNVRHGVRFATLAEAREFEAEVRKNIEESLEIGSDHDYCHVVRVGRLMSDVERDPYERFRRTLHLREDLGLTDEERAVLHGGAVRLLQLREES